MAVTRQEAEGIKQRYAWWFERKNERYEASKERWLQKLEGIVDDIQEGRQGFGYDESSGELVAIASERFFKNYIFRRKRSPLTQNSLFYLL